MFNYTFAFPATTLYWNRKSNLSFSRHFTGIGISRTDNDGYRFLRTLELPYLELQISVKPEFPKIRKITLNCDANTNTEM